MKVSTDKKRIDEILSRRVMEVVVDGSLRKKLASGKKLRVKLGVDPTAPDLHLGHTVPIKKLKEFQDLGHQVVFIIGDYTSKIGDPTGRSKTRPMLTDAQVEENAATYLAQVGKILDLSKTEVRRNSEWFAAMDFNDVVRLAAQFTVARMIERDDFANRLKEGSEVHMHELLYPMMQAHDSVMVEADVEIGGTDQKFNILAGRDLQRKKGLPEQDCLFLGPILVGTDGVQKMSKSLGNYVGITDPPEEMFGKIMSVPDAAMWDYWTLATDAPLERIEKMRASCGKGEMNPRDAKAALAKELIAFYHSPGDADRAESHFVSVFKKKETPDDVEVVAVKGGLRPIVELLIETGLIASNSKSEARRVIEQGGVKVEGVVVSDPAAAFDVGKDTLLIQKGKRLFVRVKAQ
jgi:tyrosyl-tRNA synthetase